MDASLHARGGESRAQHLAGCPNDFAQASHPNNRQRGPYGFDLISGLIPISSICQPVRWQHGERSQDTDAGSREMDSHLRPCPTNPEYPILLAVVETVGKWH